MTATNTPPRSIGDDKTDLALLKIEAPGKTFTYVKFSESDVRVGDWVVAVGNPFGLGGTVTAGIVSARGREIGAGPYDDFIQIDAAVNRGNSGGPTFDLNGEVIGINTADLLALRRQCRHRLRYPGIDRRDVIVQLREHGSVTRGWLGVQIQSITPEIAFEPQARRRQGRARRRTAGRRPRARGRPPGRRCDRRRQRRGR